MLPSTPRKIEPVAKAKGLGFLEAPVSGGVTGAAAGTLAIMIGGDAETLRRAEREKKIQGCSMGSNRFKVDMPRYVEFYRQGRLKLDEMITRRGKLEDVNEAFRAMKAGEVARTVLTFD